MKTTYGTKIIFLMIVVLAGPFFAHGQGLLTTPAAMAACGPENVKFDASLGQSPQPPLNPTSTKAVVYILQDLPVFESVLHFTTRVGVDGAWAGAIKDRSYFGLLIDPGVHHLCVSGQWRNSSSSIALHGIEAKPGETYYFAVRFSYLGSGAGVILDLDPVDEDQGQFMLQSSRYSTSHSK